MRGMLNSSAVDTKSYIASQAINGVSLLAATYEPRMAGHIAVIDFVGQEIVNIINYVEKAKLDVRQKIEEAVQ